MGRIIPYMKWKIKAMFETTNQLSNFIITSSFGDFSSVWWMNLILVGGIPTPKNMSSSDWIITFIIPTIGENKSHVPSHQPAYWVEGEVCPNLRSFFKMIMKHCNVSRWLKDVESVKNVYVAIAGSEFSCLAMNLRSLHQSSINVYHTPNLCHLNMRFLTKRHVEINP